MHSQGDVRWCCHQKTCFHEQTRCAFSLRPHAWTRSAHTPCDIIGTDEPSASARAHVETVIYGSVVITCDLPMCTLPCAFTHTHTHKHAHAGTHTFLLILPVMDGNGRGCPRDRRVGDWWSGWFTVEVSPLARGSLLSLVSTLLVFLTHLPSVHHEQSSYASVISPVISCGAKVSEMRCLSLLMPNLKMFISAK